MGYKSAARQAQKEINVKRSRFISFCAPVGSEDEAQQLIGMRKKLYSDAAHNCYAYIVGENGQISRSSDDREPAGTAGIPILEAIKARGLTYTLIVVSRYFGGVLLGKGGLARAYSGAASAALELAGQLRYEKTAVYRLDADYADWDRLEKALAKEEGCAVESADYGEKVSAILLIREECEARALGAIAELTDGKVNPVKTGEKNAAWNA